MGYYTLTPEDYQLYATKASNLRSNYQRTLAQNAWERGQASSEYNTARTGLTTQFDRQRFQLPGQFVGRGLLDSGIYQQGLSDYASDRTNAFQALSTGYARKKGEISQSSQNALTGMNTGLALNEAEKQAKRAQLASQIRSIY